MFAIFAIARPPRHQIATAMGLLQDEGGAVKRWAFSQTGTAVRRVALQVFSVMHASAVTVTQIPRK